MIRTIYWLAALFVVYGVLPRLSGLPDRLYRSGRPTLEWISRALDRLDVEEWLDALELPDLGQRSQIERLRRMPPPPRPLPVPPDATRARILEAARAYLGTPYVWGGNDDNGIDCSGFVRNVYRRVGIQLPRVVRQQFRVGTPIPPDALQPGDLIFFETTRPGPSHVGIYAGNGVFIHASSKREMVTMALFDKPYYQRRFIGARTLFR